MPTDPALIPLPNDPNARLYARLGGLDSRLQAIERQAAGLPLYSWTLLDPAITVSSSTADVALGSIDDTLISGFEIDIHGSVTTSGGGANNNVVSYLRLNGANITACTDGNASSGWWSAGTFTGMVTANVAGAANATLSGLILGTTDFGTTGVFWLRATCFLRRGAANQPRSSIYQCGTATANNNSIQRHGYSNWWNGTTVVTSVGLRFQAQSNFTAINLTDAVVKSF